MKMERQGGVTKNLGTQQSKQKTRILNGKANLRITHWF
jgi:hypothetical protein